MENEEGEEDSTTTSEEEDENGKDWTEDKEKSFLKTLCYLKKKDPKIYDENVQFFQDKETTEADTKPKKKKEHNLFLREYNRKMLLEYDGKFVDDESDDEEGFRNEGNRSPTYVEEQRLLKDNLKKFVIENEDDENQTSFAGFLSKKEKSQQEKAKEEADYIEWLKGQKDELNDKNMENDLRYLHDYWNNPQLNEGEQFLRDYILQKRYLEPESEEEKSEIGFSEEEESVNKQEEFEQSYNFRFEEPDSQFIKTYPRVIESSLRRKDDKRKKKRDLLKVKKEEKLQSKRIELKKKKIEKKKELFETIEKLKQITGNDTLGFEDADFEGDFNPDEYDQKMAQLFNEEFYAVEDDTKPEFSDIDEDMADYDENFADYGEDLSNNGEELTDYYDGGNVDNAVENGEEVSCEDPSFNMDCDYQPEKRSKSKFKQTRSSRKKGHKKSKFMEMVKKKKPIFNPADKTFQQYLDEYYSLDFEDVVADVPCRFKYRKVTPNDFGLSVEEILAADDKQLNNWCSMKKIDTIRPEGVEKFEKKIYSRKGKDIALKKKILPSLFQEDEDSSEATSELKKEKKEKVHAVVEQTKNEKTETTNKKKIIVSKERVKNKFENRKNLKRKYNSDFKRENIKQMDRRENLNSEISEKDISDERLKAYGINPKRYKNKMKYGPKW